MRRIGGPGLLNKIGFCLAVCLSLVITVGGLACAFPFDGSAPKLGWMAVVATGDIAGLLFLGALIQP